MYEITDPTITADMPQQLRGKNAQEIVTYLQSHFKTDFIDDGKGFRQEPQNKATAYMIAVSKAIFNPDDWKSPIKVWFASCGNEWVKACIIWYHGVEPRENKEYWVYSPGYGC